MNFYHFSLLLFVVLNVYSESSQHVKPPDPIVCTLGSLAPVLPQNVVFGSVLPQNGVFKIAPPQNEVYRTVLPQNEVFGSVLPQNGVFKIAPPQNEVYRTVLPQIEVFKVALPQNEVLKIQNKDILARIKHFKNYVLVEKLQNVIFKLNSVLTQSVKSFNKLFLSLGHGGKTFLWVIRISPESFQHVFKMYSWSLPENQMSIRFRCRLIGLFLKRSFFRKHDFSAMVDKLVGMVRWSPICSNFYLDKILFGRKSVKYGVADESLKMPSTYKYFGGGASLIFSSDELLPYTSANLHEKQYKFFQCVKTEDKQSHITDDSKTVLCAVPLSILAPKMTMKCIKDLAVLHKIYIPSKTSVKNAQILLQDHDCHECVSNISLFEPHKVQSNAQRQQKWYKNLELDEKITYLAEKAKYKTSSKYQDKNRVKHKTDYWSKKEVMFPPAPLSADLGQQIVSDFCADTSPEVFEETGCAVCEKLTPVCEMEELSDVENLSLLKVDGITRKARSTSSDTVKELKGPILAPGCSNVCSICVESLEKGNMPVLALANGLWVGEIPVELQNLTYAEQLLIARVRHNRCIVKVSSGMRKMCANAISFSNPMPKIYNVLPPPIEEMDEVLAFIYTGPCKPTKADFKRTPLLVRRLKVSRALHWLKLNHIDYYDCEISESNLASYPEDGPPVVVDYHLSSSNKNPESTSVHDMEEEDGTAEGPCPFIVHGLTGEEFSTKTMKTIKVIALQHLTSERKILAIGHSETPESIYGNPQLFPSMLPWLFPYGLGGIGQTEHKYKLSSMMHKRHLLMYYDKRFQKDPHFPLIAFNHEQMKESTTAGYLTAEKKTFNNITDRLMSVTSP